MAITFTQDDLDLLEKAKRVLDTKISWYRDVGGEHAREAYFTLEKLLSIPEVKNSPACPTCGRKCCPTCGQGK